jgi:hypothetical protein
MVYVPVFIAVSEVSIKKQYYVRQEAKLVSVLVEKRLIKKDIYCRVTVKNLAQFVSSIERRDLVRSSSQSSTTA